VVGAGIAREVHAAFGAGAATAHLIDAPAGRLRLLAAAGPPAVCPERLEAVPLDADLPLPRAARTGDALWIEGGAEQEAASPALARGGDGCASSVALPLHACGVPVGVLGLAFGEPRRFQPDERALLASVAEACGQALERAALFDRERGARTAEARTRALLDALVEHAPVGIGFLDRDFRFARVNRVLAEIDGLPAEAHLGRLPRELFPGIPMERIEASWRRVLETGEPLVDVPVEGETPAAPGRRRQWVESWYPVQAGAETLGLGAIVREVTAEREAEEFQRNVLGIVGHDLRNPLSTVLTAARLARRHEAAPAELRTLLDRILRSTGRMERIVSVLLDYTRVRAGTGIPLQRAGCALDALILSVVEEAEGAQPGRKVRTRFEGDGAGEWDPGRVGQAVANLVTNALVHSPPSAGVEVSLRGTDAEVEVAVWNEGPPIAPEALPRLFEPFRRGQPSGENGGQGLGLGLFIARAIVEAHGGAIEARSSAAEGTVFTVRMPRRAGGEG
jgi:PAS domain S-box-containing protein